MRIRTHLVPAAESLVQSLGGSTLFRELLHPRKTRPRVHLIKRVQTYNRIDTAFRFSSTDGKCPCLPHEHLESNICYWNESSEIYTDSVPERELATFPGSPAGVIPYYALSPRTRLKRTINKTAFVMRMKEFFPVNTGLTQAENRINPMGTAG